MKKNYWPHAIIGIIVFGMIIIGTGVYIAINNPVYDEIIYGDKKRVIDENINEILKTQKLFVTNSKIMLKTPLGEVIPKTPYLKKILPSSKQAPLVGFTNVDNNNFSINITSNFTIKEVRAKIYNINDEVIDLGALIKSKNKDKSMTFRAREAFSFAKSGVYTMSFEVDFIPTQTRDGQIDEVQRAYFESKIEVR